MDSILYRELYIPSGVAWHKISQPWISLPTPPPPPPIINYYNWFEVPQLDTVKRKLIKLVRSSTTSADQVKTRTNHIKKTIINIIKKENFFKKKKKKKKKGDRLLVQ
jgi:hypothetical protein